MDSDKVIEDNGLEKITSVELISVMSTILDMLKERIEEEDLSADDFEVDMDDMETDELCELATAVMMVISERVGEDAEKDDDSKDNDSEKEDIEDEEISDKKEETYDKENDKDDDLEGVDESYITETSIFNKFCRTLFSKGDDVILKANKGHLNDFFKNAPKHIKDLPEFSTLKKLSKSANKPIPNNAREAIMNSPLKKYLEEYGETQVKKGKIKTKTQGTTTIQKVKTKAESPTTKQSQQGGTLYTLDHKGLPEGKTLYTFDPKKVDIPIKKEAIESVGKEKVINAVNEMIDKDPVCKSIFTNFGSRAAKSFATIKYLLKIGVPVAAIGGGAMYVKGLLDNSSSSLEIPDTTPDILPQDIPSNKDKLKIEIPENPPKNNDELIITPDMISDNPSLLNNYSERERDNKKPKRIKYAGLGELFNNIGSFVDDTGTSVGSGIGKTIGGLGK